MSNGAPIDSVWTGRVFEPASPYMLRRAEKMYAPGEVLRLVHQAERSGPSHRRYFAAVREAWKNLPPLMAEKFPTDLHLRRWALIKAGYFTSRALPCGSPALARQAQAWCRPLDEFSIVTVEGSTCWIFTAKSQDYASMDKKEFRESSDKVMDVIAAEIAVSKQDLIDNADRAA